MKLRRQLRRKRHIKIELCVKLSPLRLFHVGHVVPNSRSALSLAWHEWFSYKGEEWKINCCELVLSSEPQIWTLEDYVKTLHQEACRTCSTIIFLHSTNGIIDLWRCRWCCRRQILNSRILSASMLLSPCITGFTFWIFHIFPNDNFSGQP